MSSFETFDFANNQEWQSYLRRLEIPSQNAELIIKKRQKKWYKEYINPTYEIKDYPSPKPKVEEPPLRPTKIIEPDDEPPSTIPSNPQYGFVPDALQRPQITISSTFQTLSAYTQLSLNLLIILSAILSLLPLHTFQKQQLFTRVLHFTIAHSLIQIYQTFGLPPLQWNYIRAYLQRVIQNPLSHQLFFAFVLTSLSGGSSIASFSFLMRAILWTTYALKVILPLKTPVVSDYSNKYLEKIITKERELEAYACMCEVMMGPVLILNLFTIHRNFLILFLYFQYIRLRYLMSSQIRTAFTHLRQQIDYVVYQQRRVPIPLSVQQIYQKICNYLWSFVDPFQFQQAQATRGQCVIM